MSSTYLNPTGQGSQSDAKPELLGAKEGYDKQKDSHDA